MKRLLKGACAFHRVLIAALTIGIPAIAQRQNRVRQAATPPTVRAPTKKKPVPPKQLQAIVASHGRWLGTT